MFGQTITIDGSNFQSGDTLSFVPPAGSAISSTPSNLTLHSGSQISYQFNDTIFVGGALGTWTVTVTNPDAQPCQQAKNTDLARIVKAIFLRSDRLAFGFPAGDSSFIFVPPL